MARKKNNLLPIDEINNINSQIDGLSEVGTNRLRKDIDIPLLIDTVLDVLVISYALGVESVNEDIGTNLTPNVTEMQESIYKKIENKTFEDRINEYCKNGGTTEDIKRIVETESHRNVNTGAMTTARKGGATHKTWNTEQDDKVRDTHFNLDKKRIPIDEKFVTVNGNETYFPGQFGIAEEDVNCRCWLTYSKE